MSSGLAQSCVFEQNRQNPDNKDEWNHQPCPYYRALLKGTTVMLISDKNHFYPCHSRRCYEGFGFIHLKFCDWPVEWRCLFVHKTMPCVRLYDTEQVSGFIQTHTLFLVRSVGGRILFSPQFFYFINVPVWAAGAWGVVLHPNLSHTSVLTGFWFDVIFNRRVSPQARNAAFDRIHPFIHLAAEMQS